MTTDLTTKRDRLDALLRGLRNVVVAYSGGVDSAFLTAAAHDALGAGALAVTAVSPSLARRELRDATALARSRGWNHLVVATHELDRDEYARNAPDRCYWCKTELFEVVAPIAAERSATVVVGTNLDDLGDVRPGHRAARENDVRAPMVEAALTKSDIRALSEEIGLPTAGKPAAPCLASRVAYGVRVTPDRLRRIDDAEDALRALGFTELRVRDHGDLARIEVPASAIERAAAQREALTDALSALGYRYVTLDLVGFRSGSMNEVLGPPRIR